MKKLGVIGAGEFGLLVEDLAGDTGEFSEAVFFDDTHAIDGSRIVGTFSDIERFVESKSITHLSIAVGYRHFALREQLYQQFKGQIPFATLIHPNASVSKKAELSEGVLVYSMSNIEAGAVVGANVTLFNQSSITHNVNVEDHSFLSVGVSMGGRVSIGKRCFIGVNASLVNDITIGNDCLVCGGTFLTKSIPDNTCVIGNPFQIIDRVEL